MALDAGLLIDTVPSTTGGTAENAAALNSAATIGFIPIQTNEDIVEIGVKVVVAGTTTPFAVSFFDRPCPGSGAGEVLIGVVTAPSATQASCTNVRKYLPNVRVAKCHFVRVAVTTAGGGSGTGVAYIKGYPAGESAGEPTDVASVT